MQIALTQKDQAALWVTYGSTSMSKPITTQSTPMGVDDELLREKIYKSRMPSKHVSEHAQSLFAMGELSMLCPIRRKTDFLMTSPYSFISCQSNRTKQC